MSTFFSMIIDVKGYENIFSVENFALKKENTLSTPFHNKFPMIIPYLTHTVRTFINRMQV